MLRWLSLRLWSESRRRARHHPKLSCSVERCNILRSLTSISQSEDIIFQYSAMRSTCQHFIGVKLFVTSSVVYVRANVCAPNRISELHKGLPRSVRHGNGLSYPLLGVVTAAVGLHSYVGDAREGTGRNSCIMCWWKSRYESPMKARGKMNA